MTRGREYGVLNRRGGEGERWAKQRWASRMQPRLREPWDGLRGCITCLLPDHKPPTKTLMSNVNGDNASDPFSIRDLFTQDRRSKNIKIAFSQEKTEQFSFCKYKIILMACRIIKGRTSNFMRNISYTVI